ncbi:carboxypeptidase-like regulatory domain-containing protein [Algibacter miyuki]|uniref:Carboxypeptidase-like regulatory domain-containing protein n=1 Tax=Algibacter miyuki TaxID=1306933 RepID=A0ABV5GWE8_9FLAO|nr:carboxypeptidase-like regulatory domain-containing protein [Algibacter miyuki]MDN3665298.1 carboxypeptidase-like regulatory domain-containing protein [Algibacter miyuki]
MKHLFLIFAFLISATSFAQDNVSISGNILDLESNQAPLELATITIKETGAKTVTDKNGSFKFEHLQAGTYNVSLSFVGYESKTIAVNVVDNRITTINETLGANTLSLDDLMAAFANSKTAETSSVTASN